MAEKTYNTGRVVGWSTYEEFLKETQADPNVITNFIYNTLVTYGVARRVELKPGEAADAWKPSNGGQFYTQTIRVQGASWGAVPIVGLDYESYVDVFTNPSSSTVGTESIDAEEKDAIETAVGNIFGVYVSDAHGNKATSSVSAHGYLTFVAYPDILEFNEKIGTISGGVLKLIVRGLSMEDLDVNTLYYGPQGFIFAGNGLIEDCYHETRDINNLSLNSAGYLWLSMGGNPTPADYRGLVDHPSGQILISTFGYMDLDFINGTGSFQDQGAYGLTYAEYQDALQGVNKIDTQVNAIPAGDRDDYVYLVSGQATYSEYPPLALPFYIIPVRKDTGRINVGSYDSYNMPKMKKRIDFTRLYTGNGDDAAVLYLYDKKLPEYMGNWWGGTTPVTEGLVYTGNNTLNGGRWISDDLAALTGVTYHRTGRNACWKIQTTAGKTFSKGYTNLIYNQPNKESNGVYLCTKDINHGSTIYQLNRFGGYIPWTIPQWYKDKPGPFSFEVDLTGIPYSIESGVLYVDGCPIYPGEPVVLGNSDDWRMVYVWNTIQSGQAKVICYTKNKPTVTMNATQSQNITNQSDTHSRKLRIPRAAWNEAHGGRSLTVWTSASNSYSFATTDPDVTMGTFIELHHAKESLWAYDKTYSFVVLNVDANYVYLASTMVWIDNPTLSATVGYPGTYDAVVPRYNQDIPNESGSYYYNMKSVLSRTTAKKMFQDFGWNIANYVDADFQDLSLGEFLQECVVRNDLSVPKSPETTRSYALESTFRLYSKADLGYTSGKIPDPAQTPIKCSITLTAKTSPKSFFDTAFYTATLADGTVVNVNNVDYPIWVTIAKSRHGKQTMSVSVIDDNNVLLDFSGNEGTIEADKVTWLDLLTGLGTGKAVDILHGIKVRRTADDVNYLQTANGTTLVISKTEPSVDDFPVGAIGIGW